MFTQQTINGVQCQNLAPVHDRNSITQPLRLFHVVRRVQDRHAVFLHLFDSFEDMISRLGIHSNCRFVK